MTPNQKGQPFVRRLGFALAGVRAAWGKEPSFRIQIAVAAAVVAALAVLRPAPVWWALAGLAAAGVMAAELLNSALERLADALGPRPDPRLGEAKDLAAGGVLAAALGALWAGVFLLVALVQRGWG